MTAPEDPQEPVRATTKGESAADERSAVSLLLAAIPLALVVAYQFGLVGMLLRLAPVLVFGGIVLCLPPPVRRRPWAIWMLLLGGIGGMVIIDIVLSLR